MLPKINATTKINASNELFLKVLLKNIRLSSAVINIKKQMPRANKEIKNNPSKKERVINDNTNAETINVKIDTAATIPIFFIDFLN